MEWKKTLGKSVSNQLRFEGAHVARKIGSEMAVGMVGRRESMIDDLSSRGFGRTGVHAHIGLVPRYHDRQHSSLSLLPQLS